MVSRANQLTPSSAASSEASAFAMLDNLAAELESAPSVVTAPAPPPALAVTVPRSTRSAAASAAPLSSTSASSTTGRAGGFATQGFLTGEHALLRLNRAKPVCLGYIGNKQRFCLKPVKGGVGNENMFCCNGHRGAKFPVDWTAYYVPMKDSALAAPYITSAEVEEYSSHHLIKEEHSSKEWIRILNRFHDEHQTRVQEVLGIKLKGSPSGEAFNFDTENVEKEDEASDVFGTPNPELSKPVSEPRPDEALSIARGAGAFRMLSALGLEALKTLSSNLFGSIDEDALMVQEGESLSEEQLRALKTSVDTLREAASAGFKESESRLQEAVRLLEEDGDRRTKAFISILHDLFGTRNRDAFLAESQSFAHGIVEADATANAASFDASQACDDVAKLQAKIKEMETSVSGVFNHIAQGAKKTGDVIKAFANRFNAELSVLSARVTSLNVAAPGPSDPLDAMLSTTGVPPPQGQLYLAGYHHYKMNRYAVGRTVAEESQFNTHGWNCVCVFESDDEMKEWIRLRNPLAPPSSADHSAEIAALSVRINELQEQLAEVKKSVASEKGVSAGGESFDSPEEIAELIHREGVDPKRLIGAAVDFVSFFAHERDGRIDELTLEMKQMKMVGIENIAQLHYIGSFRHMQPSRFLNSSNTIVQHGDRFPMLANAVAWHGDALVKGGNIELEKTISETSKQIDLYFEQYLPPGRLRDLCIRLNLDTTRWAAKFITYSNRELKEVANYGIPEVKTYTLLSDQWITVLMAFWSSRMLMQEFSSECDLILYVARAIFKT
jgi:TolA-binding protein